MATVYLIHGFLGAGKTTYAKKLSEETGALYLNADDFCEQNFSETVLQQSWDECFRTAIHALGETAETTLLKGKDVILDFGFWTWESRESARNRALALGVDLKHIFVTAADETLLARINRRSGPIAEHNVRKFHDLKKDFEPPQPDENPVVVYTDVHLSA